MSHSFPAFTVIAAAMIIMTVSCREERRVTAPGAPVFSSALPDEPEDTTRIKEIYYGLLTPAEACHLFDRMGLEYNDTAVLSPDNQDLYMTSYKAAMNLGVYGVDMGYMKLFGASRHTVSYFGAIRTLSGRLGIPDTFLSDAVRRFDPAMNSADSLTSLMNDAYASISRQLREEGNESALCLMLMGGWVESMYLATQLAWDPDRPDPQVMEQIAGQKYSLMSLISYMKNYYDDPMVAHFTRKLRYLYRNFDAMEIWYSAGEVETDTAKGVIRAGTTGSSANGENINAIRDYIRAFRAEITAV